MHMGGLTRAEKLITIEGQVQDVLALFPSTATAARQIPYAQQVEDIAGYLDARRRSGAIMQGPTKDLDVKALVVTTKQLVQLSKALGTHAGLQGAAEAAERGGRAMAWRSTGEQAGPPQLWLLVLRALPG